MKKNRIAALVLTVAVLALPVSAGPRVRDQDPGDDEPRIVRVIKVIKRFLGSVGSLEDNLGPPRP